jgi:hypothetical protein
MTRHPGQLTVTLLVDEKVPSCGNTRPYKAQPLRVLRRHRAEHVTYILVLDLRLNEKAEADGRTRDGDGSRDTIRVASAEVCSYSLNGAFLDRTTRRKARDGKRCSELIA